MERVVAIRVHSNWRIEPEVPVIGPWANYSSFLKKVDSDGESTCCAQLTRLKEQDRMID